MKRTRLRVCSSTKKANENPWRRELDGDSDDTWGFNKLVYHIYESFEERCDRNKYLDTQTKKAALRVSGSVVSLVAQIGGESMLKTTGMIVESVAQMDDTYSCLILTSASLLISSSDDIQFHVYLSDGSAFKGRVFAHDLHYNLAIFNIQTDKSLPTINFKLLDDSLSIDPKETEKFQIRRHSDLFNICPGEMVIALGLLHAGFRLMVAPGNFSLDYCQLDCKDMLTTTCKISKSGIGGPLINCLGEVIGINFIHERHTPFLPSNVVCKWLAHFKEHGSFCRPWTGMEVTNLYAAPIDKLKTVIQSFPSSCKGVIVEKVIAASPADSAGLLPDDVIVASDMEHVGGFLEFIEKIFDKVGETVNLTVIRKGNNEFLNVALTIQETSPDRFNRWPLPEEHFIYVKGLLG